MRQLTFIIETEDELREAAARIRDLPEYRKPGHLVCRYDIRRCRPEHSGDLARMLAQELPLAICAGTTEPGVHCEAQSALRVQLRLTALVFERAEARVLWRRCSSFAGQLEAAEEFGNAVAAMPDLKGLEVLVSYTPARAGILLDALRRQCPQVPVFGTESGRCSVTTSTVFAENLPATEDDQILICNGELMNCGIVVIAYLGADLRVSVDVNLGFTPVGKEMEITEMDGLCRVTKIAGRPAADIYRHYLNVEPDENFLFNIFEFPLTINRGGMLIGRVPVAADSDGALFFPADVHQGEMLRFAYGHVCEFLHDAYLSVMRLRQFEPQALWVYECGNRVYFLGDRAHEEIDFFRQLLPQMLDFYGNCEIAVTGGRGGQLNSSLVAVAMRESQSSYAWDRQSGSRIRPCSVSTPQLADRLASLLRAVTSDLTSANHELEDMARRAEQASEAKSRFLSGMSHEIRTPINAIIGMNEMILRETGDPAVREYALTAKSAADSLLSLVNDVLDFSKIEAGKMELIEVEYDLFSVVHDLQALIEPRAESRGLSFTVSVDPKLPRVLCGDELRLKQVLTNLLTNAVKYTEQGGARLEISGGEITGNQIELCFKVADTGIGIKQEDLPKLFSSFERIEEQRNRNIEGTGLGMSIVSRLLRLMHGHIEVQSEYGKGSVFTVRLVQQVVNAAPIGQYNPAMAVNRAADSGRALFRAPEAEVLAIDDNAVNLTVIRGLLKRTEIRLDIGSSGYECLSLCAKKRYDVILLDHRMPGMDGIETLKRLKADPGMNAGVPVVALTANAVSGAREEYLAAGFDDYLTKPVDGSTLEAMLQRLLPPKLVLPPEPDAAGEAGEALPVFLGHSPYLDVQTGMRNCGTAALYLDTLQVFAATGPAGAAEIAQFAESGDIENFTIKVHALKSSARVIGATELSERARRLEQAGKDGALAEIAAGTPGLLDLYRKVLEELKKLSSGDGQSAAAAVPPAAPLREIGDADLQDAWQSLSAAAEDFDLESVQMIIGELKTCRLPEQYAAGLKRAEAAAALPDWDALREALSGGAR